jgi:hypothetical protein
MDWKITSIKKKIKKQTSNKKNKNHIWYKNQMLRNKIEKKINKKGFKTK